jgi:small subunit ribosomal protein S19e
MASLFDTHPQEIINKAAEHLKKEVKMPPWAIFVKTSPGKERPPEDAEWYYKRAASILRKVYRFGPIGTNKLRMKYGTKKNRGHAKEQFRRGSGKIIRSILQQLEKSGYIKQEKKGAHAGRIITPKGKSFMDKVVQRNESRTKPGRTAEPVAKSNQPTAPTPQTN